MKTCAQLSNSSNKVMISRHIDSCQDVLTNQTQFSILFIDSLDTLNEMFLVKNRIVQVQNLPYSPDLIPWYFFLFPKLKIHHKNKVR